MKKKNENQANINPSDLVNVDPIAKVGSIYPNLYSQASYLTKDVERVKNEIIKELDMLKTEIRLDVCLDAIYNYLDSELTYIENAGEYTIEPSEILRIRDDVYGLICLNKRVSSLIRLSDFLSEKLDKIEITKHKILL